VRQRNESREKSGPKREKSGGMGGGMNEAKSLTNGLRVRQGKGTAKREGNALTKRDTQGGSSGTINAAR